MFLSALCVRRRTRNAELSWRDGIGTDNYTVACNDYNKVYGRGSVKTESEGWTAQDVWNPSQRRHCVSSVSKRGLGQSNLPKSQESLGKQEDDLCLCELLPDSIWQGEIRERKSEANELESFE